MNLSQRRANAIKKYLIEHFYIPAAKIEAIGYGPTRPIADNGNYQGRQQNRRVEFKDRALIVCVENPNPVYR